MAGFTLWLMLAVHYQRTRKTMGSLIWRHWELIGHSGTSEHISWVMLVHVVVTDHAPLSA